MHRLTAHPVVAAALGGGAVSLSWAQQIMDWTKPLPDDVRDDADAELLAAAAAGRQSCLTWRRSRRRSPASTPGPMTPDGDGFEDRGLRLARTLGGAGRRGDLSARCATAPEAVLGSLARPFGPEDTRTLAQRQHDALEEAMLRLIGADQMLPQRAGQPVRLELDITLDQLATAEPAASPGPESRVTR